jgi:hypothetical protein
MRDSPSEEGKSEQAIAAALVRAARALRESVRGLHKFEHAVGRLIVGAPSLPSRLAGDIQALDLAIQEIAGVALFVEALSEKIPADMTADLAQAKAAVTLEELAFTLGGERRLQFPLGAAGDFEAFD